MDDLERSEDERSRPSFERNPTAAIIVQLYVFCQQRCMKLLTHSNPSLGRDGLVEIFPVDSFVADGRQLRSVPSREVPLP